MLKYWAKTLLYLTQVGISVDLARLRNSSCNHLQVDVEAFQC